MGIKQNAEKRIAEINKSIEARKEDLKKYSQKMLLESSTGNFRASYFSEDIMDGIVTNHNSIKQLQIQLYEVKNLLN